MAIRLQFLAVVVPRSALARTEWGSALFASLAPDRGFFLDTMWYDEHLWCETSMNDWDAEEGLRAWEARGLRSRDEAGAWADLCLVASGKGPLGPCPWLAFDAAANTVWHRQAAPGEPIGGLAQGRALAQELAEQEALGEAAYARMYEARRPKDDYEDAWMALARAQEHARRLNDLEAVDRLAARIEAIHAVYRSQFRGF